MASRLLTQMVELLGQRAWGFERAVAQEADWGERRHW